ncbi:hypothetical protein [Rahnella sp. PCH160]|uniref:hypothetical protein n=1 Tax=Rahnella sp. PCH160 TaxID=3447928 RepID=UPI0039FBA164
MIKSGMVVLCALLATASLSAYAEGPYNAPVSQPQQVHKVHKPVVKHEKPHHQVKPVPVHHKVKPKPPVKHEPKPQRP